MKRLLQILILLLAMAALVQSLAFAHGAHKTKKSDDEGSDIHSLSERAGSPGI